MVDAAKYYEKNRTLKGYKGAYKAGRAIAEGDGDKYDPNRKQPGEWVEGDIARNKAGKLMRRQGTFWVPAVGVE